MTINEALKPLATDAQWAAYVAYCEQGSYGKAAKALSVSPASAIAKATVAEHVKRLLRKGAQQGVIPPAMRPVPDGLTLRGTSTLMDGEGIVRQQWDKTKVQGRDESDSKPFPGPITKVSKLYDAQGNIIQEWVSAKAEDKERAEQWERFIDILSAKIERTEPVARRSLPYATDLCACYPIGDHHLGMLAWGAETGSDSYDMKISEQLLRDASLRLFSVSPPCKNAVVAFLGDFLHYDGFSPVTPTSHNVLDADSRFPKMVDTGIRMMRHMVDAALEYHENVHVIVEIGNHDLSSSVWLARLLKVAYENDPRVSVDINPGHYHYYRFGKNLVGTHHGHGTKMDKLPMIMAADRPQDWGETSYRTWWTGHIHNKTALDFAGCSVESFRILAPADAWAAQKGYRSIRDMHSIVLHKEHGEVARMRVSPEMFTPEVE